MSFISIKGDVLKLNETTENLEAYLLAKQMLVLFFGDDMLVLKPENEKERDTLLKVIEVKSKNESTWVKRLDMVPKDELKRLGIELDEDDESSRDSQSESSSQNSAE